jgi:hypothetical protein
MSGPFIALYPEVGGKPGGFACKFDPSNCQRVTRTKTGMVRHLWRKHKIKLQLEIFFGNMEPKSESPAEDLSWMDMV